MKIEWSAAALADLDRFSDFLRERHPALSAVVAREIMAKAVLLSEHPFLVERLPGEKSIGRLYCGCSTPPMSFNTALGRSVLSSFACPTVARSVTRIGNSSIVRTNTSNRRAD